MYLNSSRELLKGSGSYVPREENENLSSLQRSWMPEDSLRLKGYLPQDKPQLFSTLVTLVRETVKRVLFPTFLHPPQTLPDSTKMKNSLTSSPQIN